MEFPYWLTQSLAALPIALWIYLGLGIPYALLVLSRQEWQNRAMVLCVAFALGPALLTAWMFIPGTIGGIIGTQLLRFDLLFAGTVVIALVGMFLAWDKARNTSTQKIPSPPLAFDERVLVGLILAAIVVHWFVVAYWTFTAYDTLWVYGFEGRKWFLDGFISPEIGYYPQFLPLQYTFMQLGVGAVDDHAARVVVPFLHWGSILAAYTLGSRLFNRRTGLILTAIWTLYPHLGMWAYVGDLEVPLAFLFTATAAFFLMAWTSEEQTLRRRYALIAGLFFGIAMWTKPTAGAFIWGVLLVLGIEFLRVYGDWHKWYPRFEVAIITGIACIPLGAIWYVRNIALGHAAIDLPHSSWLNLATRSGDLLSWVILPLFLLGAYLVSTHTLKSGKWMLLVGMLLILIGTIPSSPQMIRLSEWLGLNLLDTARLNPPASRLTPVEWLLIASSASLMVYHLRLYVDKFSLLFSKTGWTWLLALPYFLTWFWSYSYHARLSFAIVPLLALPSAALLAQWIDTTKWGILLKFLWSIALIIIGIPGIIVALFNLDHHYDWLWTDRYPDDNAKYILHNPDVYLTAEQLWGYEATHGEPVVVIAPGEQRLRFFLSQATIITDTLPTRLDELEGATHFLYGSLAQWRYENDEGIDPLQNQIVAALGRTDIMERALNFTTGSFRYELYQLHLENRYLPPDDTLVGHLIEDDVVFGGFVRYLGDNVNNTQLVGNTIAIDYLWEVLAEPEEDYLVQIDLLNTEDGQIYWTWRAPVNPHQHGSETRILYYSTQVWEVGERIVDRRSITLTDNGAAPNGQESYKLIVNFVDAETYEPVPMTINGEPAAGYPMMANFSIYINR
jgi:4-amino-4-deoxy-L-arabinose transferase-like glycosyltransferase